MSLLKELSKDTLIYGFGKALKKFIGFLLLPLYTKVLPPSEFGILDTLGTLVFFITLFFNFGLDSAASLYFFRPQNEESKGKILFTVFVLRLVVIIPSLICAFFSPEISLLLFGTGSYANVVLITCLLIPANMIMSEQELIYRFYRNAWGFNIITIIKSAINIVGGILLVSKYNYGAYGAQMAALLSTLLVVIISFLTFTKNKYTYEFSSEWAIKMLKFGFPLIWSGLAVWIYSVSDRFFLLHYRDLNEIGYYSIGSTFSQPIGLINMAIQMSFGVLFYKIYHEEEDHDKIETKRFMKQTLHIYITIAVLLTVALCIFSKEIISLVTTKEYLPGIITIPFLCTSLVFAQIVEIVPVGISLREKNWHFTWIIFAAAGVNAGLNFVLIPSLGILGAAITTLLANMVYLFLADTVSKRYFDAGFSRIKIYLFLMFGLAVAVFIPYSEIMLSKMFTMLFKALLLLSFCISPFLFQLITLSQIKLLLNKLRTK